MDERSLELTAAESKEYDELKARADRIKAGDPSEPLVRARKLLDEAEQQYVAQCDKLLDSRAKLVAGLRTREDEITEKNSKITELEQKLKLRENTITENKSKITELEQRLGRRDNTITEKNSKITELQSTLEQNEPSQVDEDQHMAGEDYAPQRL